LEDVIRFSTGNFLQIFKQNQLKDDDEDEVGPAIPEHLRSKTKASEEADEDGGDPDEVGPAIPAGFVPDKSVQVADEDAGFDEGEVGVTLSIA
jgi:hypothetical protein